MELAPELIIALVLVAAVNLYTLFGGADFGAGVWEFNTAMQTTPKERALIYRAIGPVWETNHVWLIFVLVLLFSAFPTVLAGLSRALWLPLLLGVAGIVFRGASYAYRMAAIDSQPQQRFWNAVFAMASTATPFFLGACAGAIASGQLMVRVGGQYEGDFITGWITPLSIFTAFFAVGTCAYLSAVYLVREARLVGDADLESLWRVRALSTGIWMGVLAMVGLVLVWSEAPHLWQGFAERAWPLVLLSAVAGVVSLAALAARWFLWATIAAAAAVTAVIWGWAWAQYPVLIPTPDGFEAITVQAAKGPDSVLWPMIVGAGAGAVILVPSLVWLFYLFKAKPQSAR